MTEIDTDRLETYRKIIETILLMKDASDKLRSIYDRLYAKKLVYSRGSIHRDVVLRMEELEMTADVFAQQFGLKAHHNRREGGAPIYLVVDGMEDFRKGIAI